VDVGFPGRTFASPFRHLQTQISIRCEKNCSAQVIVIGELSGFFCAFEQGTMVGYFLNREVNPVLKINAKGMTPHINRAYPLANQLSGEFVTFTCEPWRWTTVFCDEKDL
jgi:hypothetical protein